LLCSVNSVISDAYLLLQIVLTKANSTNDPMMNVVQTINHTSFAIMYDTSGIALSVSDESVMNVNMELMPGKKYLLLELLSILQQLFWK
jgi:hypothetical protein